MSNIINLPPNKKDGLYRGELHEDGGIATTVDGVKKIEIEDSEYYMPRHAMESTDVFEFKDKTNKQILDKLFREEDSVFKQGVANSGDFIICRLVVLDEKKRDIKGTVKEIVNTLQSEKSCNMTSDSAASSSEKKDGGNIDCGCQHEQLIQETLKHIEESRKISIIVYANIQEYKMLINSRK